MSEKVSKKEVTIQEATSGQMHSAIATEKNATEKNTTGEENTLDDNKASNVAEVEQQYTIEVVYGTPERQKIITLNVAENTTIEQAILASGIIKEFSEIDLTVNNVGIWNRAAKLTDTLHDLDRIEIYRPLIADPKEVRKRRAEKAKEEGRADKVTGGRVDPRRSTSSK